MFLCVSLIFDEYSPQFCDFSETAGDPVSIYKNFRNKYFKPDPQAEFPEIKKNSRRKTFSAYVPRKSDTNQPHTHTHAHPPLSPGHKYRSGSHIEPQVELLAADEQRLVDVAGDNVGVLLELLLAEVVRRRPLPHLCSQFKF